MAAVTPEDRHDTRPGDLRRLARGTSLNLAGSFVSVMVNLLLPIVVTRRLISDDAGAFFSVTALFSILIGIGSVGADVTVLWGLPRTKALGRTSEIPEVIRTAIVPVLVVSTLTAAVVGWFASEISGVVAGGSASQQRGFTSALYVLAAFLPLATAYGVSVSMSRGLGSVRPLVYIEKIGRNALQTSLVVTALVATPSLMLAVVAWSAPYVAAAAIMGLTVFRLVQSSMRDAESGPPRPRRVLVREFWVFSAPRAVSRLFAVGLQRFDILLVSAMSGLTQAAIYAAASRFLLLGLMFVQAIQQVMAPRVSEFLAQGNVARANVLYETTTAWLIIIAWPIYLMSALFAPFLLKIFGPEYASGADVVVILCLGMLVATACGPVDSVLLMGGRSLWSLLNTGLALAVNVGVDLALIPRYGITGAAIGWAIAIAVNNLIPLFQVHRFLRMHPFGGGSVRGGAIALVVVGGLGGAARLIAGGEVIGLVLAVGIAGVVYLPALWWQRDALELGTLLGVVRRRRA